MSEQHFAVQELQEAASCVCVALLDYVFHLFQGSSQSSPNSWADQLLPDLFLLVLVGFVALLRVAELCSMVCWKFLLSR